MRTGLHCNTVRDPDKILDYYRRSKANVIKVLEYDRTLLTELDRMGVTIIGRAHRSPQRLDDKGFLNELVNRAREYPMVDYWEGFNEEFQWESETARYAEWEIDRMKRLETVGAKACIASFSCGQLQLPSDREHRQAWPRFRPALEYALRGGHALGLHEYSGPFMQWMCGANQWDHAANQPKRIDDPCLDPRVEGFLTLRYRRLWRECMVPWGLGALPLFITEGGIDDVWPRPGPQGKGYKDWRGTEWERIPGIGDYAQQRRWYMWQVSHDAYVRGVVDFGFETADPTWQGFDLSTDSAMLDRIIQLESDLPVGHHGTAPTPVPPTPVPPTPAPPAPPFPTPVRGPFVAIEVQKGEGAYSVARRAYDLAGSTPAAVLKAKVAELQAANPGRTWSAGAWLRVPGREVR